jgi:hypothetical protein
VAEGVQGAEGDKEPGGPQAVKRRKQTIHEGQGARLAGVGLPRLADPRERISIRTIASAGAILCARP